MKQHIRAADWCVLRMSKRSGRKRSPGFRSGGYTRRFLPRSSDYSKRKERVISGIQQPAKKTLIGKLQCLHKLPDRIASFFRNADCRYKLSDKYLSTNGPVNILTIMILLSRFEDEPKSGATFMYLFPRALTGSNDEISPEMTSTFRNFLKKSGNYIQILVLKGAAV